MSRRVGPGMKHKLMARARWGQTTLDAIVSEGRRVPLSTDLGAGGADLWLTSPAEHGATVHVPPGGRGTRTTADGATEALAPGDHALSVGARAEVVLGELVFELGWTRPADALVGAREVDGDYARVLGMTAVVHGVLVLAALEAPRPSTLGEDLQRHGPLIEAKILVKALEPKSQPQKPALAGLRAPKPEGQAGPRDRSPRKTAPPRSARDSGLLAFLTGSKSAAATTVFGRGGMEAGLARAMHGLDGVKVGDPGGLGGLGSRGPGPGGGGPVGIGGLGVGGRIGGPGGPGGGIELGGGGLRGPTVTSGRHIEVANIDREAIARVIRQHLARFKHCYEKELNANPSLSGKVAVRFTIAPTGKVAQAVISESTVDDGAVERCVVGVMESLPFPAPKGGGVAVVTYPFVFAST